MTMPGFTAEVSDYRSGVVYATGGAGAVASADAGAQITPQIRICTPCIPIPVLGPRKICVNVSIFPPRIRFEGLVAC